MEITEGIYLDVTTEKVSRLLGYGKDKTLSPRISKKIDRLINKSHHLLEPNILHTAKEIKEIENGSLIIENGINFKSRKMTKTLKSCDRIVVFLATVGKGIDNKIKSLLKQKRVNDAYIFDAIGSVAVEETVEKFQGRLNKRLKAGNEGTTLRFSPGYCDWQIQEQRNIFKVINSNLIDVELGSSCLMTPKKSVSGIFGIGNIKEIDKDKSNPCLLCGMKDCIARREEVN